MFKRKKKKTGVQTPEYRCSTPPPPPPMPPVKPPKTHPTICSMKLDDLKNWVKTRAQIGDVAYCHDHITDYQYIYCYRKPDDDPKWCMIQPEFLTDYLQKENEGDNKINNKTMYGLNLYIPFEDLNDYIHEYIDDKYEDQTFVPVKVEINKIDLSIDIKFLSASTVEIDNNKYKINLSELSKENDQ